jgi:hypothetical protein
MSFHLVYYIACDFTPYKNARYFFETGDCPQRCYRVCSRLCVSLLESIEYVREDYGLLWDARDCL